LIRESEIWDMGMTLITHASSSLPNVGKSTLFNAMTAGHANVSNYPFTTIEPNVGMVTVPDERLDAPARLLSPAENRDWQAHPREHEDERRRRALPSQSSGRACRCGPSTSMSRTAASSRPGDRLPRIAFGL
jgi:hypothetical protein